MTTHLTFRYRGYGQISETILCRLIGGNLICDKLFFPKTLKQQFLAFYIFRRTMLHVTTPPLYLPLTSRRRASLTSRAKRSVKGCRGGKSTVKPLCVNIVRTAPVNLNSKSEPWSVHDARQLGCLLSTRMRCFPVFQVLCQRRQVKRGLWGCFDLLVQQLHVCRLTWVLCVSPWWEWWWWWLGRCCRALAVGWHCNKDWDGGMNGGSEDCYVDGDGDDDDELSFS